MKSLKTSLVGLVVLLLLLPAVYNQVAHSQAPKDPPTGQANVALTNDETERDCPIEPEVVLCRLCPRATEAPTGFDDQTNGFIPQPDHDANRATFEVRDQILPDHIQGGGLGPVYNAQSCAECHQNPVSGAVSQITELRAGRLIFPCDITQVDCDPFFQDAPGGSLINDRAVDMRIPNAPLQANIQERVPPLFSAGINPAGTNEQDVRTARTSLNLLGDGFVEAIANQTLLDIAAAQPGLSNNEVHGLPINVPVEERRDGRCRIGRFGHKDQHASLLSFSGDAYINEIGITNRLFLAENTSLGRSVANFDFVSDSQPCANDPNVICGEDTENDIDAFTDFVRSTKAPPRDAVIAATTEAGKGETLFKDLGCAVCHQDRIVTAPRGTSINLGAFIVPTELGSKIIHPYSDFLLHDIGTGDGIRQNGRAETRLMVRTAPLWGVRTHTRLMHDGASLTFKDAIARHHGEAETPRAKFFSRSDADQRNLIIFLESL